MLESDRLATIGRMATSVSHDFRHYLATIFANAEFLASDRFSPKERAEIFEDIRAAVNGTTDMIESLLIFSRTGASIGDARVDGYPARTGDSPVRAHPDAEGVTLTNSMANRRKPLLSSTAIGSRGRSPICCLTPASPSAPWECQPKSWSFWRRRNVR